MKFFIAEKNISDKATKEQTEKVIALLRQKGWEVDYGAGKNVATEVSEFGQEEAIQNKFSDDFMTCCALIEDLED